MSNSMENAKDNWNILRERIKAQLEDCRRHRGCSGSLGVVSRAYNEVLNEMDRIESGTQSDYVPYNGVWKTKNEISDMNKCS